MPTALQTILAPQPPQTGRTLAQRVLDPTGLQQAQNIALGFGPGTIKAWHGTGTTAFSQFADPYISTGEGAQAYGWGHYVAGEREAARSYQLPPTTPARPLVNGMEFGDYIEATPYPHYFGAAEAAGALRTTINSGPNWIDEALRELQGRRTMTLLDRKPDMQDRLDDIDRGMNWLQNNRQNVTRTVPVGGGHLLEVNIKPDEHELLDYDLPYSQQTPEVQNKLKTLYGNLRPGADFNKWQPVAEDFDGWGIYADLAASIPRFPGWPADLPVPQTPSGPHIDKVLRDRPLSGRGSPGDEIASKMLHDAGIPGLKFKDQFSRNLPQDDPNITRNYVIFHPDNLEIKTRDGIPLTPVDHDPFAGGQ